MPESEEPVLDPFEQKLLDISNEMVDFSKATTQQIIEQWDKYARLPTDNPIYDRARKILAGTLNERIATISARLREDPELIVVVEQVLLAILTKTGVPGNGDKS